MAKITFPVEAGHIMLFARAVGDTNPVYQDAEAAKRTEVGGIIAPPTFPQAVAQFDPDYPLRWRPNQPWFGSGGGLHAEQHFEYHRPLRPGDVLTVETKPGNTWERESKRAGKLTFRERITEYRDQNGDLVVTARSVGVTTERPVERAEEKRHGTEGEPAQGWRYACRTRGGESVTHADRDVLRCVRRL